jgi:WhiB family redox-sensing transcriptional regulator
VTPSPVTTARLLELHDQGLTQAQIAQITGLSRKQVSKRLVAAGISSSRSKLPSAALLAEMLLYESATTIARRYGASRDSVYSRIHHARARGELAPTPSKSIRTVDLDPPAVDVADLVTPCKMRDPEEYFPTGPQELRMASAIAEMTCDHCHLRDACYAGAVKRKEPWGVWGGRLFRDGKPVAAMRRGAA